MNKKMAAFGSLALMMGFFGLSVTSAVAYRGDPNAKGPNYSPDRHEAMQRAFADKEYDAWAGLMQGRGRVTEVINKGNFARFAEAHDLALQGRTYEAKEIRQELGLGLRNGKSWHGGRNR